MKESRPLLLVRLCSDKAGFEALPQRKLTFRMSEVRRLLETEGRYEVVVETPYIMVLKNSSGVEVTLSEDGRMLIKRVSGEEEANTVAHEILKVIKPSG